MTATALGNARRYEEVVGQADNLRSALASRSEIEQAKGIIMHASGCDAERAFASLRKTSQREQRKLVDVARHLIAQCRHSAPVGEPSRSTRS